MNRKIEDLNRKLMSSVCPGTDQTELVAACDQLNLQLIRLQPENSTSVPINSSASPPIDIAAALPLEISQETVTTVPFTSVNVTEDEPVKPNNETQIVARDPKTCPANLGPGTACYDRQPAFSCYCLIFTHQNWWDSSARCQSRSMNLVSIETLEEQQLLQILIVTVRAQHSTDFIPGLDFGWWTSGSDAANEGVWIWSATGQPVTDLGRGVPDDGSSYNNGLLLYSDGFYWVDAVMSDSAYSICEY